MPQSPSWSISTFYRFVRIEDPATVAAEWTIEAERLQIEGLLILGAEGFNITCSTTSPENLEIFKAWVVQRFDCPNLMFKDSKSKSAPFAKFKFKIRPEIVTSGTPDLVPDNRQHRHLSPEEWNETLQEEGVVVLDTRNWYEVRIGTFKQAIDPQIEQFTEFPKFVEEQNYPKDQKMLIFCTGGIRCEKGILELERRGYHNVFQLEGGILNYLEKFPEDQFRGECFVFDNRVAVDQSLQPTVVYKFCPHCGQPGEMPVTCSRCDTETLLCVRCSENQATGQVCSKNCAHHAALHPGRKGRPQILKRGANPSATPDLISKS